MELKKSYQELPPSILELLQNGNVFFSESFANYINATGAKAWYVYDENYCQNILVTEKARIKYGLYYSEPLILKDNDNKRQMADFLNVVAELLKKEGLAWIYTSAAALFPVYPDESMRIPFGSHIIDLSLSEEELMTNMHSKHRNSIRRAERNDVSVVRGGIELIDDYLKADVETWGRSDRNSYGRAFFEKILVELGQNAVMYVAYKDGLPQSGACYFINRRMCYYMYGASITNPEPGAANLMQWKAIKDMKASGVEKFSFVGCRINEDEDSKYHGIQRFKERFGGTLYHGYMFKQILNPFKYSLFRVLYRIKNRHSLSDAVDQEINKWTDLQKSVII